MRIWIALLVSPVLALTDQSIAFALVGWACEHQANGVLHASHAVFLALTTASALSAWLAREQVAPAGGDAARQHRFLATMAAAVAALSAATIAAMWLPTWIISSCVA